MTPRRELQIAVGLCLLGGLLLLAGAAQTWVTVTPRGGLALGQASLHVSGAAILPGLRAVGIAALAGAVAVVAVRGWGRSLLGVVLLALGGAAAEQTWRHLGSSRVLPLAADHVHVCYLACPALAERFHLTAHHAPQAVALLGSGVLIVAALLVVLRGRGWAGLSSSYEAPGAAPEPPVTEKAVWDALDRGDDPTA
jgi:uncharacterized membrane protein (TIGR02234 family)